MISYHTVPVEIAEGKDSQGFFAYEAATDLIIFVHGFKGAAMETWDDFAAL